jgi:hypothetical protein
MRTFPFYLAVVFALLAAIQTGSSAVAEEPDDENPDGVLSPPRCSWYAQAEGVALFRNVQRDTIVAYSEQAGADGAFVALKRNDLDDQFTGGGRFTLGHVFGDSGDSRYSIEMICLWQAPWRATASASDLNSLVNSVPGNLFSSFTDFGYPPSTKTDYDNFVEIHENSRLGSQEMNLKGALPSPDWMAMTILVGARHLTVHEEFDYLAQPTTSLADPTVFDPSRTPNTVITHTLNDLWGPQCGVVMALAPTPNTWIEAEGKGAICNNGASRDLDATIAGTTYPHDHLFGNAAAYVGEVNVTAFWRATDAINVRIGFQAIFIDGLVLACENFNEKLPALTDQTAKPPLDRRGRVAYYGPRLGVELHW